KAHFGMTARAKTIEQHPRDPVLFDVQPIWESGFIGQKSKVELCDQTLDTIAKLPGPHLDPTVEQRRLEAEAGEHCHGRRMQRARAYVGGERSIGFQDLNRDAAMRQRQSERQSAWSCTDHHNVGTGHRGALHSTWMPSWRIKLPQRERSRSRRS